MKNVLREGRVLSEPRKHIPLCESYEKAAKHAASLAAIAHKTVADNRHTVATRIKAHADASKAHAEAAKKAGDKRAFIHHQSNAAYHKNIANRHTLHMLKGRVL